MSHTPGPWRLIDGKSEVVAGDCYHVAYVKAWFPEHSEEQEANARLIAEAPEMLDVLKLARVMLDAMIAASKGNIHDHCISTARRIDEVIQKVTVTDADQTSAIGGKMDSTKLALDVSLEKARALHRVWRALNDGDCPSCHRFHAATEIVRNHHDIECPSCGFYVTRCEIADIEKMFAPAMDAAVRIFLDWRSESRGC